MDLDGRLLQAVLDEESRDLGTLVALQLDDLTHLLVLDKGAVAGELLRICMLVSLHLDGSTAVTVTLCAPRRV